jgi:hypothetical protein
MDQRPLSSPGREDRRGRAVRNTLAVLLAINVSVLVFAVLVIGLSRLPALPGRPAHGWNWPGMLIIGGTVLVAVVAGALVVRGVTGYLAPGPSPAPSGWDRLAEDDPPGQRAGRRQLVPSPTRDDPPLG